MKVVVEVGNSFCTILGDLPETSESLISTALTYRNDVEAEVERGYFLLHQMKKWRKSKKELDTQRKKIKNLEDSEVVHLYVDSKFPTGLLRIVEDCLNKRNTPFTLRDLRERPDPYLILPWNNKPFSPRYYQREQIDVCVEAGRAVIEAGVGTGKTLTSAYVIKALAVKTLFIVPSSGLGKQTSDEFRRWFGASKVANITTQQVRAKKTLPPIRVITIQSLSSLKKTGDLGHLLHGVDALFIDEAHHSAAKTYTDLQLNLDHIYFRYSMTGTFCRNDSKILALWGVLSNVGHRYPATQAIKDGFLTPLTHVTHKLEGVRKRSYPKEYDENYGGIPLLEKITEIVKGTTHKTDPILILVKLKNKCGELILEYLKSQGEEATFISGDNSSEEINDTISEFNEGRIRILIGSSVLGEGVDIQSSHHLINAQGGKSVINVVQGAGRLVRLYAGNDLVRKKTMGMYHDFDFVGTQHQSRHFKLRKQIIDDNFSPSDFISD